MTNTNSGNPVLAPKFICGIGASAGGLDALSKMLQGLPAEEMDLCIIVAQHLSPTHKSHLVDLLGKNTNWLVKEAENGEALQAMTVYITPPNNDSQVQAGRIILSKPKTEIGPKPSVDLLFQSIAKETESEIIGIILSGTGRDGSNGVKTLKAAGGIVLIQDPETATYDGMPLATFEQGVVDGKYKPEKLGTELLAICKGEYEKELSSKADRNHEFYPIFDLLEKKTGVDFSDYKINTIQRRLYGRLNSLKIKSLEAYLDYINTNPSEVDQLFNSVLIGVTQFLRDPEHFEALKKELEKHIQNKGEKQLRIWVPGCATGEEAYTIGILISELLGEHIQEWSIQIFATDIDDEAIGIGRRGIYAEENVATLPDYLKHKYFTQHSNGLEVVKEIRGLLLFSRHDLSNNPPFLKLDLISCRNLLIYFKLELQKRVIPIFHYALLDEGILFLGKSENLGVYSEKFTSLNKKAKIYSKLAGSELESPRYKALRPKLGDVRKPKVSFEVKSIPQRVEETLYNQFTHPYAVVNETLDILYISGDVQPFMKFNQGAMTANLIKQCRKSIELIVHTTVQQAIRELEPVSSQARKLNFGDKVLVYRILAQPMLHFKDTYFLVVFESFPIDNLLVLAEDSANAEFENIRIAELELELDTTKEHLQSYIEELETANEEMQALNEELQSTNEELQSVNEELETSNEEMQSTNEEMQIAYQELRDLHDLLKSKEKELELQNDRLLSLIDNNLQSFFLLDPEFQVLKFNTNAQDLVLDLANKKVDAGKNLLTLLPAQWANEVSPILGALTENDESVQLELSLSQSTNKFQKKHFLLNFSPVFLNGEIKEISLAIIDFTEKKTLEIELKQYQNLMNEVGATLRVGGWELDLDSGESKWTKEVYAIHEVDEDFLTNLNRGLQFYPPEAQNKLNKLMEACIKEGKRFDVVLPFSTAQKNELMVRVTGNPIYENNQVVRLWGIFHDVTEEYYSKEKTQKLNEELRRSNIELQDFAYVASHDLQEPLRMVSSFSQLFYDRYKDQVDDKGLSYLNFANDGAQRMQKMLEDLLEYSRIGSNKEDPKPCDLNEILDKAIANLKIFIDDKAAEVRVGKGLGEIQGIESQIIRLFQNLIHNGLKFNESKKPRVTIEREENSEDLVIQVIDNGIGIDPDYHEKVFSIFHRLHTNETYSGNGMGLAICKRIASRNNIEISLNSVESKGCIFSLKFN